MELPVELKQVEGHLSWMEEALQDFMEDPEGKSKGLKWLVDEKKGNVCVETVDYRRLRHRSKDSEGEEGEEAVGREMEKIMEGPCTHLNPVHSRKLIQLFNHCVQSVYLEEFGGAFIRIEQMRQLLEGLTGEHARLRGGMQYFVEVLEWSILKLQKKDSEEGDGDKGRILIEKWEALHEKEVDRAVILYVKASFQRELNLILEAEYLQILLKVINLDPGYFLWHHYAYRSLRAIRRGRDAPRELRELKSYTAPVLEEMELCQTAYDLAPHVFLNIFHLAMMLKDCLGTLFFRETYPHWEVDPCPVPVEESLQKCLQLFDTAVAEAEKCDAKDWMNKCRYWKSELLLNLGEDEETRSEGLQMLLELVEGNPENTQFRDKLAKIFTYGVGGERRIFQDLDKAKYHVKVALEVSLQNRHNGFYSVKYYIKLFKQLPPPLPSLEALEVLNTALENANFLLQPLPRELQVHLWRACILWIYNPEATPDHKRRACQDWVWVAEKCPDMRENILGIIDKPPFKVHGNGKINDWAYIKTYEVKRELERVKWQLETASELEAVNFLLERIAKVIPSQSSRDYGGSGGWSQIREGRRDPGYRFQERQPARRTGRSVADQDNDWRRK